MPDTSTGTAGLNVGTSVVDAAKSKGLDSSYDSRAGYAKGIGMQNYTGTADQNETLRQAIVAGKVGSAPDAGGAPAGGTQNTNTSNTNTNPVPGAGVTPDVHTLINGAQDGDIKTGNASDVPTKDSITGLPNTFSGLKDALMGGTKAPTVPSLSDEYTAERSAHGIDALQTSLDSLSKEEANIRASKELSVGAEFDKPVAMNVINGRVSEQERNFNARLDSIALQKTAISDQIKTANDAIDTVMKYKSLDYANAKDEYHTQLTTAMDLYKTLQSNENVQVDNARANLSIMYNAIQSGGLDLKTISPEQKNTITSLEMKSGLPVGFYQNLQNKNPKADVLSTTTRDDNGHKYADVLFRDPATGAITSKSFSLGASSGSGGGTVADKKDQAYSDLNGIIDSGKATTKNGEPVVDANGYITPAGFKQMVAYGSTKGLSKDDIISQYGDKLYAGDAGDYKGYGLTLKQSTNLIGQ